MGLHPIHNMFILTINKKKKKNGGGTEKIKGERRKYIIFTHISFSYFY